MSHIQPVVQAERKPLYSAVKIQINSPKATIPEDLKNNDNEYNAVNIEVNEPEINSKKKSLYSYPEAENIVTYDQAGFLPIDIPEVPASQPSRIYKTVKTIEMVEVPEPNFTTVEAEKSENKAVSFNGLNFKAAPDVILSAKADIEPSVNIDNIISELKSSDYDRQAVQIDKIASTVLGGKNISEATQYLTTGIFSSLSDIVSKDTSKLTKPNDEQIEARKKIVMNMLLIEKALQENPNLKKKDINTGVEITKEDVEIASKLSPFEMAERNKEYAMYTLAGLIRLYTDEYKKNIGDTVPFTDLPGISAIMNAFKSEENPDLKIAAINSLAVITKPEYSQEISSILKVVAKDKNPAISQYAMMALKSLEKNN